MKSGTYKKGLAMRKKVLGADYVQARLDSADAFTRPLQDIVTEFAWGGVWTRPGLPLKVRSLITLAMCIALNRPAEIKIHLRGAVRNGCSRTEIRELLLHSLIYCGGPAALDAFHAVVSALPEIERAERKASARR